MHIKVPSNIEMNLLALVYDAGGNLEKEGERGTSHLMEHLMCKTFDDQLSKIKRLGIDYNAYTSNNRVVFYFSGLEESIAEMGQLLYDRITGQEVLWKEEEFNIEKKTVLQEYGDAFNDQIGGFMENVGRKYYGSAGAIGVRKDVEDFSYENSLKRAVQFKTPNFICEVGKSVITPGSFSKARDLIAHKFGVNPIEEEPNVPKEDKTAVGLIGNDPIPDEHCAKVSLIIRCITDGLESPLYKEIREDRGLSYFSHGGLSDVGMAVAPMFLASTDNDNADVLANVYKDFFDKKLSDIISEERFNICKESTMINKRIAEILPHQGAMSTIVGYHNPFKGIAEMSYGEAMELFSQYFTNEKLHAISY
jgi:predicted Zn-dependent peptidase